LDEEYKYIIPTNSKALEAQGGIFGRINETGQYVRETD
jgi:hypothetical protein